MRNEQETLEAEKGAHAKAEQTPDWIESNMEDTSLAQCCDRLFVLLTDLRVGHPMYDSDPRELFPDHPKEIVRIIDRIGEMNPQPTFANAIAARIICDKLSDLRQNQLERARYYTCGDVLRIEFKITEAAMFRHYDINELQNYLCAEYELYETEEKRKCIEQYCVREIRKRKAKEYEAIEIKTSNWVTLYYDFISAEKSNQNDINKCFENWNPMSFYSHRFGLGEIYKQGIRYREISGLYLRRIIQDLEISHGVDGWYSFGDIAQFSLYGDILKNCEEFGLPFAYITDVQEGLFEAYLIVKTIKQHINQEQKTEGTNPSQEQACTNRQDEGQDASITDKPSANQTGEAKDDKEVHTAIDDLRQAKDENGEKLFYDQGQWFAVYRVLKEYFNYPEKMSDFVRLIEQKGWAEEKPLCKYNSIRSINTNLPLLSVKVSLWNLHKDVNDKYKKQYNVAEFLLKRLGIK